MKKIINGQEAAEVPVVFHDRDQTTKNDPDVAATPSWRDGRRPVQEPTVVEAGLSNERRLAPNKVNFLPSPLELLSQGGDNLQLGAIVGQLATATEIATAKKYDETLAAFQRARLENSSSHIISKHKRAILKGEPLPSDVTIDRAIARKRKSAITRARDLWWTENLPKLIAPVQARALSALKILVPQVLEAEKKQAVEMGMSFEPSKRLRSLAQTLRAHLELGDTVGNWVSSSASRALGNFSAIPS